MATKELTIANRPALVRVTQLLTCVALLSVCGCASTNYKRADAASESLQRAGRQIEVESYTIDLTVAALDDLVNKEHGLF